MKREKLFLKLTLEEKFFGLILRKIEKVLYNLVKTVNTTKK